jgi:hypothetical protein
MSYVIYMDNKRDYKKESDELSKLQRAAIAAKDYKECDRLTALRREVLREYSAAVTALHNSYK